MIKKKPKKFLAKARSWATKRKLFGAHAFLRYVMLTFLDNLNNVSDEFIFKGGNLLWLYISTPRATVDLDLVTLNIEKHEDVKAILELACKVSTDEIHFSIKEFEKISQKTKVGAKVTISYKTDQGAHNAFDMDIVYQIKTYYTEIESPISLGEKINIKQLEKILLERKVPRALDPDWINENIEKAWKNHRNRYKDLPESLQDLFITANKWLF
jgi:hypothetical protein